MVAATRLDAARARSYIAETEDERVRKSALILASFLFATVIGCVERRFVVTSEPFGAVVYNEREAPIGATPADQEFTWYGTYQFKLVKDGYQTKVVQENIKAPWYEWPIFDFVSENLVPWNIRDIRRLHYKLDPLEPMSPDKVRSDGDALRQRGATVGPQLLTP